MPPAYRVVGVEPDRARADLERLWSHNLTVEAHVADKFAWLYLEAPLPPSRVLMLTTEDGAAVGTAGVGVREFQLGDATVRAGLLADLAVDKAHRSVGPALALVRAGKAYVDETFALGYGFPNKLAEGVFKRAGYTVLGAMTRYAMPLRHAAFVDRVDDLALARVPAMVRPWLTRAARAPRMAALAGAVIDVATLARRGPAAVRAATRLRVETATRPDPRFDALWASARSASPVLAARTARFLTWRFGPRPGRTWYVAVARATGAARAYALVDREDGIAHIRDLFGHPEDVRALLDQLPILAYRAGAESLSMRYLGAATMVEALTARGFVARPGPRTIAVTIGAATSPAARALLSDVEAWHMTDADEDV